MSTLDWDEPRHFRRAKTLEHLNMFSAESAKTIGIVAGCLLGLRILVGLNPRPSSTPMSWPNTLVLALVVGVVAGVVAPWLIARIGMARVVLSEKGINHNVMRGFGWQINFHPWSSINEAKVSDLEGQPVLIVTFKSGEAVELALSPHTSSQEVEAYVARYLADN